MSDLSKTPSAGVAGAPDTDEESSPADGAEKLNQSSTYSHEGITPTPTYARRIISGDSSHTLMPEPPPPVLRSKSDTHRHNGVVKRMFRYGGSDPMPVINVTNHGVVGSPVSSSSTLPPLELDGATSPSPSQPPSRAPSIKSKDEPSSRRSSFSKPDGRPASTPGTPGSSEAGSHRFTLKDLLASGPKVPRKPSMSSKRSDASSEHGGGAESTSSLIQKYGVCERVAIGKGATSVVRLAHKWDRTEEKLYAVKARA